jgi:hypothetical protein
MRKNKEIERRTDSKRRSGALERIPAERNHFSEKSRANEYAGKNIDHGHSRSLRSEVTNVIEFLGWRVIERKTGFPFS